jgi:hypothetical protein
MKSEIVAIQSHANTDEKLDVLHDCIQAVKKQGYQIILSSHIKVPNHLVELVDYFIYDAENPLIMWNEYDELGAGIQFYINLPEYHIIKNLDFNHGFAALKLFKNAAHIAKSNSFNVIHFVNFDYVLNEENVLKNHSEILNHKDVFFYIENTFEVVVAGLFSIRVDKFIEVFDDVNSKKDYCNFYKFVHPDLAILEHFIPHLCRFNNLDCHYENIKNIETNNILDVFNQDEIYGLYSINQDKIRLIFCKDDNDFYLYTMPNTNNNVEVLILQYGDRSWSFEVTSPQFIKIPAELMNGFKVDFGSKKINLEFNLKSNAAFCDIKDKTLIKKIENI